MLSHNLLFTTARQTVRSAAKQCPPTTCFSPLPTGQWPSNPSQSPLLIRVSFALQGSAQLNLLLPHCLANEMRHCEAVLCHDLPFPTARQAVPGTSKQCYSTTCSSPLPGKHAATLQSSALSKYNCLVFFSPFLLYVIMQKRYPPAVNSSVNGYP